jgi:hypothetical protein
MDEVIQKTTKAMQAIGDLLATIEKLPASDARALAVARTQFETALLWTANAVDGGGIL